MVDIVSNYSKHNNVVLDVFGGSGSTLIACEKTNRNAYMMELDPKYCDVIVKRWQNFTGKTATLESDGLTFTEVTDGKEAA
jgi:DNA modification methylase